MIRPPLLLILACALLIAQAQKPLDSAYTALRAQSYEAAIDLFHQAITAEPNRPAIRKDLAYTYLKIGEPESARTQFGEAMRLDPSDTHVALEYAFLCNETGHQAEARRIFDRIRKTGDATAEQAFQNIDRPLAAEIARWSRALELSPANFSAHHDLAQLAEQRDDLPLAAEHFEKAFQLKPDLRSLLLDLARVRKAQGRIDDSTAALLAASRGGEPRTAEAARELLPARYPYVYDSAAPSPSIRKTSSSAANSATSTSPWATAPKRSSNSRRSVNSLPVTPFPPPSLVSCYSAALRYRSVPIPLTIPETV